LFLGTTAYNGMPFTNSYTAFQAIAYFQLVYVTIVSFLTGCANTLSCIISSRDLIYSYIIR